MRVPRILLHIFDNESTTVTLGFWVFIVASLAAFVRRTTPLTPELWLWCVVLASILVGGKLVSKSILEAVEIKMGGKPDPKEDPEPVVVASPEEPPK